MERKTKIIAEDGKQELLIVREFDLPVELLFKAYSEKEFFSQWMGTTVTKFDMKNHGSYQFETSGPNGMVVFKANGTIHEFITNQKITRTFEMENTPFPAQLEYLEFEPLTDNTSKLIVKTIYKSIDHRDQMLALPFAYGLNMAHDRLQEILHKLK